MRASKNLAASTSPDRDVSMRCPNCRKTGIFYPIWNASDVLWYESRDGSPSKDVTVYEAGMRKCPNDECHELVFVVIKDGRLTTSYPPEAVEINPNGLPTRILTSLQEAATCYSAGCYRAAALMVRRVLEELCDDREAAGRNLKERIAALGQSTILPKELLEAADELRLLGNDAAHIEAKTYDAIEAEEVEAAFELAKELLKAIYQYGSLVSRLRALKKPISP